MKPLNELTRAARIRRFRALAEAALTAYGLKNTHLKFLRFAGNILFRVYKSSPASVEAMNCPFKQGQYLLRIHDRHEQTTDAIKLEMAWLSAIREDLELPVPEPVKASTGNPIVQISIPGIPEMRDCTLLRWLRGRRITRNIQPRHFQAQGRIMAQLHNHAEKWAAPKGLIKRRYDYDGLFNDEVGAGLPNSEAWALLPDNLRRTYEAVARRARRIMDDLGGEPDIYGLIHADCGVDANLLFWKGEAQVIDFDGSGFGYYLYDLAIALEHCWDEPAYPQYLDSLLKGYAEFRHLPAEQLQHLDLFRAAFYVYMGLWTVAMDQTHLDSPNKLSRHQKWLGYGLRFIERYLERSNSVEKHLR